MLIGAPAPDAPFASLGDALAAAGATRRDGITLIDARERERTLSWDEIATRARRAGGALAARGVRPGERVAIVLRTSADFLDAFFGAVMAGAVPVPLYPPIRLGDLAAYHDATARMLRAADAAVVVTDRQLRDLLGVAVGRARPRLGLMTTDALVTGEDLAPHASQPDDLALVQFSSGTTVDPKPVALTHGALIGHVATLRDLVLVRDERGVGVSWLPLYHDMGLIGCLLGAVVAAGHMALIPPEVFIARPALWPRAISRHRAVVSPAPSFAYALCAAKVRDDDLAGVDLSSWRMALDGAEAVSPDAARRFTARFAPNGLREDAIVPVYGLAEATLAVSFAPPGRPLVTRIVRGAEVVSVGRPVPGVAIAIRRADGREADEGAVGRIRVRGPSVMAGYLGRPDATARAIVDGWLDTGDLGFVADGELYVCGRADDVLVVRGANHDPVAIEAAAGGVAGVRPGAVVAVMHPNARDGGDGIAVLAEARRGGDAAAVADAVRAAVSARTGLRPSIVELLAPGTLPRTSSGKLRRREALRRYLAGKLGPPRPPRRTRLVLEAVRSRLALLRLRARRCLAPG